MNRPVLARAVVALAVLAVCALAALTSSPTLGLDLRGGTQIVLEARGGPDDGAEATDRVLEVLRERVDRLGVAEPELSRSGERRIVVDLPGLRDPAEAAEVLGRTAQLSIHPVVGYADPAAGAPVDESGAGLALGPAALVGEDVRSAQSAPDQSSVGYVVNIDFAGGGADRWRDLTARAACGAPGDPSRRIAIVLDDEVISSPQVVASIPCGVGMLGGSTQITGSFGREEAAGLAVLIEGGALPVPVELIEQRTVGPSLGADAIEASVLAVLIGTALTAAFLVAVYRLVGVVAIVALGGYALISYATLSALGATLTLPGLAAFVLAVGMAVDANVLIAERAREEYARRPRLGRAAEAGHAGALSAILDVTVTSLLAAALLFTLASGPVRGFGVTLIVGVLVSLFSALVLSRLLTLWMVRLPAVRRRPRWSGIASVGPVRRRLEHSNPGFLDRAGRWLAASGAVVAVALAGIAAYGLDLGVEFTGGRSVDLATAVPVGADAAREAFAAAGYDAVVVRTTGDGAVGVRGADLDDADVAALRDALAGVAGGAEVLQDELVGPSLGTELTRGALIALGVALAAQLGYLALRFRWTFSTGAVAALAANAAVVVGVFAWTGRTLDSVFVAALLTVIGYSVNDSVVVFDRVRAGWGERRREPFHRVVGAAILATVPRTVNTGLSTLLILGTLLVLGGETLSDFALALIVGIVVGTLSTVTIAAPLTVALERRHGGRPPARRTGRPTGRAGRGTPRRAAVAQRAPSAPGRAPGS